MLEIEEALTDLRTAILQQPGGKRIRLAAHRPYPMDDTVPRSYFVGLALVDALDMISTWLQDNPKRKTVPRSVLEKAVRRFKEPIPVELDRIIKEDYTS